MDEGAHDGKREFLNMDEGEGIGALAIPPLRPTNRVPAVGKMAMAPDVDTIPRAAIVDRQGLASEEDGERDVYTRPVHLQPVSTTRVATPSVRPTQVRTGPAMSRGAGHPHARTLCGGVGGQKARARHKLE